MIYIIFRIWLWNLKTWKPGGVNSVTFFLSLREKKEKNFPSPPKKKTNEKHHEPLLFADGELFQGALETIQKLGKKQK